MCSSDLKPDGSPDPEFSVGTGFTDSRSGAYASVRAIVIQPSDGRILVGGSFTHYNGSPAASLARLNTNGSLDGRFDSGRLAPDGGAAVLALSVDDQSRLMVGGNFNAIGDVPRPGLSRLLGGTDSNEKSRLDFATNNIAVVEDAGHAVLRVVRSRSTNSTASIAFRTLPWPGPYLGLAEPGVDFVSTEDRKSTRLNSSH